MSVEMFVMLIARGQSDNARGTIVVVVPAEKEPSVAPGSMTETATFGEGR
jgi:hypothetical protein